MLNNIVRKSRSTCLQVLQSTQPLLYLTTAVWHFSPLIHSAPRRSAEWATLKQQTSRQGSCHIKQWRYTIRLARSAGWIPQWKCLCIMSAITSLSWVCGRSLAEIVGSNPGGDKDVCLLWLLGVVREMSLRRANHSSTRVLTSVVCLSVIVKPR